MYARKHTQTVYALHESMNPWLSRTHESLAQCRTKRKQNELCLSLSPPLLYSLCLSFTASANFVEFFHKSTDQLKENNKIELIFTEQTKQM